MTESSCFRVFYACDGTVLAEMVEATALSEAIGIAEARCCALQRAHYFEIWQNTNLVFSSADQRGAQNRGAAA